MDSGDEDRKQDDLDWLYGSEHPSVDRTRQMGASELAELERRRAGTRPAPRDPAVGRIAPDRSATHPAAPETRSTKPGGAPATRSTRVVHTEEELAGLLPPPEQVATPAPGLTRPRTPRSSGRGSSASRPARTVPSAPTGAGSAQRPPHSAAARGGAGGSRRALAGLRMPHPKASWWKILVALLVAWLVYLVAVPFIAIGRSQTINEAPAGERPAQQPGTMTLLVGSDARAALTPAEQQALGTGTEPGERTDTMMLLYAPPSGKPVLLSLPRDSYVPIPGHNRNKLNAAYSLGGPQLLVQTIEQDTGLRVDNYIEVGFDGFSGVVDALGGVRMCLPTPMVDKDSHTNLPAGCQTLDGKNALGYVRMRKADPLGDLGRVKRQQAMIGAIMNKALSPWTFINPFRYWDLSMASGGAIKRGHDTGVTDLMGVANTFRTISSGDGLRITVPVSSTGAMTSAGSSVLWDKQKALDLFTQMASGNTDSLAKYAK